MNIILGDVRCAPGGAVIPSGTPTVILGPFNLFNYKDKSFTLYNYGTTLSGALIQVNPDHQGVEYITPNSAIGGTNQLGPNAGLWETIDSTTFNSFPSGSVKSVQVSAATGATLKWWRVIGTAHQNGVMCSGWMYARSI